MLLEAVSIADVPALEGRDEVLSMVAERTTMEGGLVDPEAGLAPDVQVPHDLDGFFDLEAGLFCPATVVAAATGGPGPGDFKAVAVAVALVGGDGDSGEQTNVDGDCGHGRPR
jgi:hypothetical protein